MNTVGTHTEYRRNAYLLPSERILKIKKNMHNSLFYNYFSTKINHANLLLISINHVELHMICLTISIISIISYLLSSFNKLRPRLKHTHHHVVERRVYEVK